MITTTTKIALDSEIIDRVLRTLGAQKSVKSRVQVLQNNKSPLLVKACYYAYNPYITYGVKVSKTDGFMLISLANTSGGLDIDDPDIWRTLDELSKSSTSSFNKMSYLKTLFARLNVSTAHIVLGILNKSLVTGVSASTINKAWPDTIPTFSVQLAQKYADRKIKSFPQYVDIKWDGVRATAIVHVTGEVEVMTRTGRPIPAASYFHQELRAVGHAYKEVVDDPEGRAYDGCVVDGELCGDTFNDSVSIFRSDAPATTGNYNVFDILPKAALSDPAFVSLPYAKRREILAKVMAHANKVAPLSRVLKSQSYLVNSKEEIWKMYHEARKNNLEGVIVKSADGLWEGKRSNSWLKIKAELTSDLRVIGAFEGEGEKEGTLGGLIVDYKGESVRVGSGYSDALSAELWSMFLRDLRRHEEGVDDPDQFELIGCLAEVQYQEVTPAGSLRHPVFIRLRKDKDEVSF